MGQGHGMSLLARAYYQSKKPEYLKAGLLSLRPFHADSSHGGVLAHFMGSLPWYEEYPTQPPSFVLNGFVYSLIGLYDLLTLVPKVSIILLSELLSRWKCSNVSTITWSKSDLNEMDEFRQTIWIEWCCLDCPILSYMLIAQRLIKIHWIGHLFTETLQRLQSKTGVPWASPRSLAADVTSSLIGSPQVWSPPWPTSFIGAWGALIVAR